MSTEEVLPPHLLPCEHNESKSSEYRRKNALDPSAGTPGYRDVLTLRATSPRAVGQSLCQLVEVADNWLRLLSWASLGSGAKQASTSEVGHTGRMARFTRFDERERATLASQKL